MLCQVEEMHISLKPINQMKIYKFNLKTRYKVNIKNNSKLCLTNNWSSTSLIAGKNLSHSTKVKFEHYLHLYLLAS